MSVACFSAWPSAPFLTKTTAIARRVTKASGGAKRSSLRVSAQKTTAPVNVDENVEFYQVRALVRPWLLDKVVRELNAYGIMGARTERREKHTNE